MKANVKPPNYWTLERCKEDAIQYISKADWRRNSNGYHAAKSKGWLDLCCGHMIAMKKPDGYWTLKRCKEDAKKYKTKTDWQRASKSGYGKALRNGWLDQCCGHMRTLLHFGPRTLHEFLLSHDIKYIYEHRFRKSPVKIYPFDFYLPDFNLVVEYHGDQHREGSKGFYGESSVKTRENDQIKKVWCKNNRVCYIAILDWEIKTEKDIIAELVKKLTSICKRRGIALVLKERKLTAKEIKFCEGGFKHTLKSCKVNAKKYKSRTAWYFGDMGAYTAAKKHGWLDQCCAHMVPLTKPMGYWTLKRCKEDAKKYSTRSDWAISKGGAYQVAHKNKWLKQCCAHMTLIKPANGHWTLERCKASAKKYKNRSKWAKAYPGAYDAAKDHGWVDQCCTHMTYLQRPNGSWFLESCKEDALKYQSRAEWKKNTPGAYSVACKNGWLNQCCSHMIFLKKPDGFWTLEKCQSNALKFQSKGEWHENSGSAYKAARENGWIDQCCGHMISLKHQKWTHEACQSDALKYKYRAEWKKNTPGAYNVARKNGWLEQCCGHMLSRKERAALK